MHAKSLVAQLSKGIAAASRSKKFCTSGSLANISPRITIPALGEMPLPLKPATAKKWIAACSQAPYGKGTKTLVDRNVRDAYQLTPKQFEIANPKWDAAIETTVRSIATQLGLPPERLDAQLYNLLLYRQGGFFLPHRDSEKNDRMVASMIVALPSAFSGGVLTVRHGGASAKFPFEDAAAERSPCYAAFYADCEHEVSRVTDGYRLCLAYNLVLRPAPPQRRSSGEEELVPELQLAESISKWEATAESEPLVFALDHYYTQRGLSLDLLKGNDRTLAELICDAVDETDCVAYLCQVSRHILQSADDGDYPRSRWDRWGRSEQSVSIDDLELGEIYEDEVRGTDWADADGVRQKLPAIPLSPEMIVASMPVEQWTPTSEEYEGFTGNAGNTLDRWYHRTALCVWPKARHFDVIAHGNVNFAFELLPPLMTKWRKGPKKNRDAAHADCVRLARAIVANWPRGHRDWVRHGMNDGKSLATFPKFLAEVGDAETSKRFLAAALERDPSIDLGRFIIDVCGRHGPAAFADELTAFFQPRDAELNPRDCSWLAEWASEPSDDPARVPLLAALTRAAAVQFCREPKPGYHHRINSKEDQRSLHDLLRTLLIVGDGESLENVICFAASHRERFALKDVVAPSLAKIVAWLRGKKAAIPARIEQWLHDLRQELLAATESEPQPPADWTRPAEIACKCRYCSQLNEFLANPNAATGRIAAAEHHRSHLQSEMRRHQCDATDKLEKKGSPYALVLTKTSGSFERRHEKYVDDRAILATVEELLETDGGGP